MQDPTLPTAEIEIGGTKYTMCLDLNALADAEAKLNRAGEDVRLLESLGNFTTLNGTLTLFAASLQRFHPEIAYADARRIPDLPSLFTVRDAIGKLWLASMPTQEESSAEEQTVGDPLPAED